jgi:DNA polymerase-1
MAEAPRAYDLELAVSWVCIAMSQRGSHIDREYTQERLDAFHKYTVDCERWCMEHYGVKPGQNASIVEVLRAAGYTFTKETEAGAVCLDKEVLSPIDHPLAQTVLSRRQVQKVASTYLRNFLQYADDEDNIHPNINPLGFKQEKLDEATFGVRTGRMSMDHPNFQNLPRKGTSGAGDSVRSCVIARPGHTLLMVDFDQIEARLIAHLTEDPGFIAAFSEGDFFVNVVRELWDDPTVEKSDPRRQSTKNGIYARSYGAGPDKFAKTTGITVEAAYAFYQRLDQVYPGWQALTRNLERTARQRLDDEGTAYVRSPLTRRKHTADGDKLYVLMNYLIQGTASEVLKMKLVDMSHAGLDEFMTLPVHDEMICDVPDEDLLDVAHTAVSIMSAPVYDLFDQPLKVPLTASASKGQRWGSKTDL